MSDSNYRPPYEFQADFRQARDFVSERLQRVRANIRGLFEGWTSDPEPWDGNYDVYETPGHFQPPDPNVKAAAFILGESGKLPGDTPQ